jgi:hypothetical protein
MLVVVSYERSSADLSTQRDHARIKELSDRLINGINAQVEHVIRNGDAEGYPGCVNLSFAYVEGESLLMALKVHTNFMFLDPTNPRLVRTLPCRQGVRVPLRLWSRRTFSAPWGLQRTWPTPRFALASAGLPQRPRLTLSSRRLSGPSTGSER